MSESNLWTWLKKVQLIYGDNLHINRIENAVISGMPDIEGCIYSRQFWIELKYNPKPSRLTTKIKPKFRPKQIPWMESREKAGGNTYVLWQIGKGHEAERFLFHGGNKAKFLLNGYTIDRLKQLALLNVETPVDIIKCILDNDKTNISTML